MQVHLKADTGMGRIGFALRTDFEKAVREMAHACQLLGLAMTAACSSTLLWPMRRTRADVASTAESSPCLFRHFQALKTAGHEPASLSTVTTFAGSVMLHPEWLEGLERSCCMARPGIILYG